MDFWINIDDYFTMFTGILTLMITIWGAKKALGLIDA